MARLCTLASGSGGNSLLLSEGGRHLLVDMGISLRKTAKALERLSLTPADLSGVLITHSHTDHICGLGTLCRRWNLPIFATPGAARGIAAAFPEAHGRIVPFDPGDVFDLDCFAVKSFPTPHDSPDSVCFRIALPGGDVGVMTDLGYVPPKVLFGMEGVNTLVLESNHDVNMLRTGPYPYALKQRILSDRGHLSNERACEAAVYLAERGTRRFVLAHLSKENNTPELAGAAALSALGAFENLSVYISPPDMAEPIEL